MEVIAMTEIEEIQKNILLKWQYIYLIRKEITELEKEREDMLVAELSERKALKRLKALKANDKEDRWWEWETA